MPTFSRLHSLLFWACLAGWLGLGHLPIEAASTRSNLFEAWMGRMDVAGGVHAWDRRNSSRYVFQEWTVLLESVKEAEMSERKRMGERLTRYFLEPPLKPLGRTGTQIPVPGSEGDYDMTLVACLSFLGLFEADTVLLPNPVFVHLLGTLSGLFGQSVQGPFEVGPWRFPETENHVFMTEGSRLLGNEMLVRNVRGLPALRRMRDSLEKAGVVVQNDRGPLRRLILQMMSRIMKHGFFEINARVYQRYTLHALLNLQAFSRDVAVQTGATVLLDYLSALFALQSCESVRWGPYRRSSETYEDSTVIQRDAVTSYFAVQSGRFPWSMDPDTGLWAREWTHAGMALWSEVMPYRVPSAIRRLLQGERGWFVAEIRSGLTAAARTGQVSEAYVGGPHFVFAAGGPHESFGGTNFPTEGRAWSDAPWVYDILNRPAALVLAPSANRPRVLSDLPHFRGSLWKAPFATVVPARTDSSFAVEVFGFGKWEQGSGPLHMPASFGKGMPRSGSKRDDDSTSIQWTWPDWGLNLQVQWPKHPQVSPVWRDTLDTPMRWILRPWLREGDSSMPGGHHWAQDSLPFAHPFWRGWELDSTAKTPARCLMAEPGLSPRHPHVRAFALPAPNEAEKIDFVCADGQGHFYAFHAGTKSFVSGNFSLWWRPLRRVFP
jgi:hypothetical protein